MYTTGLYRLCKAKAGLMRGLLGVSGQEYYEFTTEGVLAPDTFQHLEWHCFKELFDSVERDSRFRCVLVFVIVVVVYFDDCVSTAILLILVVVLVCFACVYGILMMI